jgi:RimJ/RimL family protein N-acetyltransferase
MPNPLQLEISPLEGAHIRLEPYREGLKEEVRAALDWDPEGWDLFATSGRGDQFEGWWTTSLAQMAAGTRIAYAVRNLSDARIVGTTSLMDIRPLHRGVEIGATFLHPSVRSSAVNPESKLLLLAHAFDSGAARVELITDGRNLRSQAAIAKLGAVREGVLRRERITWTGHIRDSVIYSITDQEWPVVRAGLLARLA